MAGRGRGSLITAPGPPRGLSRRLAGSAGPGGVGPAGGGRDRRAHGHAVRTGLLRAQFGRAQGRVPHQGTQRGQAPRPLSRKRGRRLQVLPSEGSPGAAAGPAARPGDAGDGAIPRAQRRSQPFHSPGGHPDPPPRLHAAAGPEVLGTPGPHQCQRQLASQLADRQGVPGPVASVILDRRRGADRRCPEPRMSPGLDRGGPVRPRQVQRHPARLCPDPDGRHPPEKVRFAAVRGLSPLASEASGVEVVVLGTVCLWVFMALFNEVGGVGSLSPALWGSRSSKSALPFGRILI